MDKLMFWVIVVCLIAVALLFAFVTKRKKAKEEADPEDNYPLW
jgi:hypothetical protein